MQQGTNNALCSRKATNIWLKARYNTIMTEKSGENWEDVHPEIDHSVVHNIAGAPHGSFAMGDSVIGPSDAASIKTRKRVHEASHCSQANVHQMEANQAWRTKVENALQALAEKANMDFTTLMHPESEPNLNWCERVERALEAMTEVLPIDLNLSALFHRPSPTTHSYYYIRLGLRPVVIDFKRHVTGDDGSSVKIEICEAT